MPRCENCNTFCGLETQEPEVESLDVSNLDSETVEVTATIRVVRNSECCGDEMKECSFDVGEAVDVEEKTNPETGEPCQHEDVQITEESVEETESGGSRYKKNMIGFTLETSIRCDTCGMEAEATFEDAMPASGFDELY